MTSNADARTPEQLHRVSPLLARDTAQRIDGDLWKRPGLSARDRSLVTVAALIARAQPLALEHHVERALDNGVTPRELSETIAHLAYYSGWGNATAAIGPVDAVFARRAIGKDQLDGDETPLEIDEAAEARRAKTVNGNFGDVAPRLVDDTTDFLFRDLWLRPGLAARDRSLVTIAALVASGQVGQITFHLNRAMDTGLTQEQATEAIAHLAFYAGWPNAMSALPVAKGVFEKRETAG